MELKGPLPCSPSSFFVQLVSPFQGHGLLFSLSSHSRVLPLHTSFWYYAIWRHLFTLCLSNYASVFQQAFFLRDFHQNLFWDSVLSILTGSFNMHVAHKNCVQDFSRQTSWKMVTQKTEDYGGSVTVIWDVILCSTRGKNRCFGVM